MGITAMDRECNHEPNKGSCKRAIKKGHCPALPEGNCLSDRYRGQEVNLSGNKSRFPKEKAFVTVGWGSAAVEVP